VCFRDAHEETTKLISSATNVSTETGCLKNLIYSDILIMYYNLR